MNNDSTETTKEADESLRTQKKLVRQLRWLNILISSFGILFLVVMIAIGFLLFQVITFAKDTGSKIDGLQQSTTENLDVRSQACADSSLGEFLKNSTTVCD